MSHGSRPRRPLHCQHTVHQGVMVSTEPPGTNSDTCFVWGDTKDDGGSPPDPSLMDVSAAYGWCLIDSEVRPWLSISHGCCAPPYHTPPAPAPDPLPSLRRLPREGHPTPHLCPPSQLAETPLHPWPSYQLAEMQQYQEDLTRSTVGFLEAGEIRRICLAVEVAYQSRAWSTERRSDERLRHAVSCALVLADLQMEAEAIMAALLAGVCEERAAPRPRLALASQATSAPAHSAPPTTAPPLV